MPHARRALKQGRSVTCQDRVHDEAILVDDPQSLERGAERGAADEHTALRAQSRITRGAFLSRNTAGQASSMSS